MLSILDDALCEALRFLTEGEAMVSITCKTLNKWGNAAARRPRHIELGLGAQLLGQQHGGDLKLETAVGSPLQVLELPAQPDVPPDGLHHPQADSVELGLDPDGGDLVLQCSHDTRRSLRSRWPIISREHGGWSYGQSSPAYTTATPNMSSRFIAQAGNRARWGPRTPDFLYLLPRDLHEEAFA